MSDDMREKQVSENWLVKTSKWEGLNWKEENSSKYLWDADQANEGMGMSKAHTSGTPSDEQSGIGDGVNEVNRDPQMLEVDQDFDNPREMGSVTENPSVKARMMSPTGEGSQEFAIDATNKPPISRPINSPSGSPVDLLSKAIALLSAPPDEVDIADSIGTFLKGQIADDMLDADKTNWEPLQRPSGESIASGSIEEEGEEGEEPEDTDVADVGKRAHKAAKSASKKVIDAAKNATSAAVAQLDTPIDKQGEGPEALTIKAAALMKALNDFEDHVAIKSGDYEGIMKVLSSYIKQEDKPAAPQPPRPQPLTGRKKAAALAAAERHSRSAGPTAYEQTQY